MDFSTCQLASFDTYGKPLLSALCFRWESGTNLEGWYQRHQRPVIKFWQIFHGGLCLQADPIFIKRSLGMIRDYSIVRLDRQEIRWAIILSTLVLLSKRMGRSIVMSTIRSKSAGWNGGTQQEFYVIVTFRYGWRKSFIGLLLDQLCYMTQNVRL